MNFSLLFNGQENLLVLLSAFIIGGIVKTSGMFNPVLNWMIQKSRSKRMGLMLVSLVSGVLPVEGRVTMSAPILDSMVHTKEDNIRQKFGILDFVSTHHYYLWSPLEKSVLIVIAGLGISYAHFLSMMALPLLAYAAFLACTVFLFMKESDVVLPEETKTSTVLDFVKFVPFLAGIVTSIFYPPYYVFPAVAVIYILIAVPTPPQIIKYINWRALLIVALVIALANIVKANESVIREFLHLKGSLSPVEATTIIFAGAGLSFILGSSSKYAGIAVALSLVFGAKYFPLIFMCEYAAYLLSPTHKCLAISMCYFNTRPIEFYRHMIKLAALMVFCGLITFFIM